jgi:hypothetical protein
LEAHVLELKIAPWYQGFECFADDRRRVFETCRERTAVDVVELLGEEPLVFCVVYFELTIGWDTSSFRGALETKWKRGAYNAGWIRDKSVPIT